MKRTFVYRMRAWNKAVLPCSTSARIRCNGQLKFFAALCMAATVCKSTVKTDFRVTNEFWRAGKFTNTESMNNENDCILLHYLNKQNNQKPKGPPLPKRWNVF